MEKNITKISHSSVTCNSRGRYFNFKIPEGYIPWILFFPKIKISECNFTILFPIGLSKLQTVLLNKIFGLSSIDNGIYLYPFLRTDLIRFYVFDLTTPFPLIGIIQSFPLFQRYHFFEYEQNIFNGMVVLKKYPFHEFIYFTDDISFSMVKVYFVDGGQNVIPKKDFFHEKYIWNGRGHYLTLIPLYNFGQYKTFADIRNRLRTNEERRNLRCIEKVIFVCCRNSKFNNGKYVVLFGLK
jgi:hypothetical protein